MSTYEALIIVLAAVVIVQSFLNSRQIDIKQVNQLLDRLAPRIAETPTQADDLALEVAKALRDLLAPVAEPIENEKRGV